VDWQTDSALATIVSSVAIVASAIFVVVQLRQATRDRYFQITSHLFEIWQSPEFRDDELYLLHKLPSRVWEEFVAGGRGERAERALHRVGGFYDRVGSLIRHKLINEDDILPTIGGFAIAVWERIEPLVLEARRRENSFLFQNFEAVLPTCRECYVPSSAEAKAAAVFARSASRQGPAKESRWRRIWFSRPVSLMDFWTRRIAPAEAKRRVEQEHALILDVTLKSNPVKIRGAVRPTPRDLSGWLVAVQMSKDVITYCT
jgi:hypothetical protein